MAEIVEANNMLGIAYPFYLNNANGSDLEYLVYTFSSPSLSENGIPYITFSKIGEKTKRKSILPVDRAMKYKLYSNDGIIFNYCTNSKEKNTENIGYKFVSDSLKKFKTIPNIVKNGQNFPLIELQEGCTIQKNLLISLRNSLRWTKYNFSNGNFIDVLWSPETFIKFIIHDDGEKVSLKPEAMFKLTDFDMKNPISVDNLNNNLSQVFTIKDYQDRDELKAAINDYIRVIEKNFDKSTK